MIGRIQALCMSFSLLAGERNKGGVIRSKTNSLVPSFDLYLDEELTERGVIQREQRHQISSSSHSTSMAKKGEVVMVTGGSGFLGQHVVKMLQEKSDDIREIRIFDQKPYANKLGHADNKPIISTVGDIRQLKELTEAMEGVDSVIHVAGLISYGTFPDYVGMEQINVDGTNNVIQACIDKCVKRLIYTSTVDVVVGDDEIYDGDESLPVPHKFLFPGYPETKYHAESAVLRANGTEVKRGEDQYLHTLVLRPPVMYGEGDPYYVAAGIRTAIANRGVFPRVGNGKSLMEQAYVGNVAWAHVIANRALSRDTQIGGHVFFITDDTPRLNASNFIEIFLKARGLSLSTYYIPYSLVYCLMYATEAFLHLISPIYKVNLKAALCSLIYVNRNLYFNRNKAERMLGYKPLYDFNTCVSLAMDYYKHWTPEQKV